MDPPCLPTSALHCGHVCVYTLVSSMQKGMKQQPSQHLITKEGRIETIETNWKSYVVRTR